MREIKFRAWDGKQMTSEINLRFAHGLRLTSTSDLGFDMIGDDKCVLMQYTGLKDKNGKEIYEGDILKYLARYPLDYQERNPDKKYGRIAGPVTWEDGWLYAEPTVDNTKDGPLLYKGESKQWEIIGNIFENPDLLK